MRFSARRLRGVSWFGLAGKIVVVAAVGACVSAPGWSARATTTPATTLVLQVVITTKGIVVGQYAVTATHDGLIPLGGPIPRGDFLNFRILNRERRTAAFSAFGKTTSLKAGSSGHFDALALRRGTFAYRAVITGGKTLGGTLIVD
jgi:hypothetical protein